MDYFGKIYPLRDRNFPTVDPENPARLNADEKFVLDKLVASFRHSEKLQSTLPSCMPRAAYTTLRTAACCTTVRCP